MADYIPDGDGNRIPWLQNYKTQLPTHGPTVGETNAVITGTVGDVDAYLTKLNAFITKKAELQQFSRDTRAMESALISKIRAQAGRFKKHGAFTPGIGEALRIIGAEETFDPMTFKPKFTAVVLPGTVHIEFIKGKTDGVNIYRRLKGQTAWTFVARDTNSPYDDATPLSQPGAPEHREYAMRGVIKDVEIGQMSDIVAVVFAG